MSVFANILPPVLGSVYAPVKPDVPSNLLLQKYKDAVFAHSLRKLNANYLGNGLRIRRSTDNIEVNVAFDGQNKISTSSSIYNVDDEPTYEVSDDVNWTAVSGTAVSTNFSRSTLTIGGTYSTPYRVKLVFDATLSAGTRVTFGTFVSSISGSNWKVYPAQSDNSLAVSSATTLVSGSQGGTFTLTADATHFILENTSGTESISCSGMTLTGSRGDTAATTLGQFISEAGSPPDMHVVTWYGQSAEANNATQAIADEQPRIVINGSIQQDSNGNTLAKFDGTDNYIEFTDISVSGEFLITIAFNISDVTKSSNVILGSANSSTFIRYVPSAGGRIGVKLAGGEQFFGASLSNDTNYLLTITRDDVGSVSVYVDGILKGSFTDSDTFTVDRWAVFSTSSAYFLEGSIMEGLIYNFDQSSNRVAIEANIANQYGITLP